MDPISGTLVIVNGIAWVGKKAWKIYQIYNDLKEQVEQTAKKYWNKIKIAATTATTGLSAILLPVFGTISSALAIPLSLAASVFSFVVAMVAIGFTAGLMWGLKPTSHNWNKEKKSNYLKNPKLILQRGYDLFYRKLLYYWKKFGIHIVRVGVPVLFGLLAVIGAATPIGWTVIAAVAVTMVVGFAVGLSAGYFIGKHYRYGPDAKKGDINENIVSKDLDEQEQAQIDKLIDFGLGEKLRFTPQGAYGLNAFSQESLIMLLLLENNVALPKIHQPENQGLDNAEVKLPDHLARIDAYYNPGVKLLALAAAINTDRDLIKGPAFVKNFHSYLKQELDVIESIQKYKSQNNVLTDYHTKVLAELKDANQLVTLQGEACNKFDQLTNKYKKIEIDQRNGLVLWDGSLLGHIDDTQFFRKIESAQLEYIDQKGVEQTFMANAEDTKKRKELAKALKDYWSACEAVSSKLKRASIIDAQGYRFIIPDDCGPELNKYRYFSYAMLKRQAQLYFPAFKDVHDRIGDAIKVNKNTDKIGWSLSVLTILFPLLPVPIPVPIVGWIFRNIFEMVRKGNWSWRGLFNFKNASKALGKSLSYSSQDRMMQKLHGRVKSDLDNRKAFMAEHEAALATALHNHFQEMKKYDESEQKDADNIHEQDVEQDKAISKYIENNGNNNTARLSILHYGEFQTFVKAELDHESQAGRADGDKAKWLRQLSVSTISHFHAIANILNIDVFRKAFIGTFFSNLLEGEGQDGDLLFHTALKETVISKANDVAVWLITSNELNLWIDQNWPSVASKWPELKQKIVKLSPDQNVTQLKSVLAHNIKARVAFVEVYFNDLKHTHFLKVEKHFHINDVTQIDIDRVDRIQLVQRIERNRHLIRTQFDEFSKLHDAAQPNSFKKVVDWLITNAPFEFIRNTFPQLHQDVRESEAKADFAKKGLSEAFSQFIGVHADQSGLNHHLPISTQSAHAQNFIKAYNQSHSFILSLLGRLQNQVDNDKDEVMGLLCSLSGYGRIFQVLEQKPDVFDKKISEIAQDFPSFEVLISQCHTAYLKYGDGENYQAILEKLYAHGILGKAFKASVNQLKQDKNKASPEAAALDLISQCVHQPLDQHRFHYPSFKHLHVQPQWSQVVGQVPASLSDIKTILGLSYMNHLQALSPVRHAEISHALKKAPKGQLDDEKQEENQGFTKLTLLFKRAFYWAYSDNQLEDKERELAQFIEENAGIYLTDEGLRKENLQFILGLRHVFMRAYQLICMHDHQVTLGKTKHEKATDQISEVIKKDFKGPHGMMLAKAFGFIQGQMKNIDEQNFVEVRDYLKMQIEQFGVTANYYRFVHPHYYSPMLARLFKMNILVDGQNQTVGSYIAAQLKEQLSKSVWQDFIKKNRLGDHLDLDEFLKALNAPEIRAIVYRNIVTLKERGVSTRHAVGQEDQQLGVQSFEHLCQQVLDYLVPKQTAYNPAERLHLRFDGLTGDYGELMNIIFELPPSQATFKSATAMLQIIISEKIEPNYGRHQAAYHLLLKIINGTLEKNDLKNIDVYRKKIAALLPHREFADVRYDAEHMLDKLIQRYCLDYHYIHGFKEGDNSKKIQYREVHSVFEDSGLTLHYEHIDRYIADLVFDALLDPDNDEDLKRYYAICKEDVTSQILILHVAADNSKREVQLCQENIRLWLHAIRDDVTGQTQQRLKRQLQDYVKHYQGKDTYIFPLLLELTIGVEDNQNQYGLLDEISTCLKKRFECLSEAGPNALHNDDYEVLVGKGYAPFRAHDRSNKLFTTFVNNIICANPLHTINYAGKFFCVGDFIAYICLEVENFYDQEKLIRLYQSKAMIALNSRIQEDPFDSEIETLIETHVPEQDTQSKLKDNLYTQRRQLLHTILSTQGHDGSTTELHALIKDIKKERNRILSVNEIAALFGCASDFSAINDAFYACLSSLSQQDNISGLQSIAFDLCEMMLTPANAEKINTFHYIKGKPSESHTQFTQRLTAFRIAGEDTKKMKALLQEDDSFSRVFRWAYTKEHYKNTQFGRWRACDMEVLLKDKPLTNAFCQHFIEKFLQGEAEDIHAHLRQAEFVALHYLFRHVCTQTKVAQIKMAYKKLIEYLLNTVSAVGTQSHQVQENSTFKELKNTFIRLLRKNWLQHKLNDAAILPTAVAGDHELADDEQVIQQALQETRRFLEWAAYSEEMISFERDALLDEIYTDVHTKLRDQISIQFYLQRLINLSENFSQWLEAGSALLPLLQQQVDSGRDTSGQIYILSQSLQAAHRWLHQHEDHSVDLMSTVIEKQWQENAPTLIQLTEQVIHQTKYQREILSTYGMALGHLETVFTIHGNDEKDIQAHRKTLSIIQRNQDKVKRAHQGFQLLKNVEIKTIENSYSNFISHLDDIDTDKQYINFNDDEFKHILYLGETTHSNGLIECLDDKLGDYGDTDNFLVTQLKWISAYIKQGQIIPSPAQMDEMLQHLGGVKLIKVQLKDILETAGDEEQRSEIVQACKIFGSERLKAYAASICSIINHTAVYSEKQLAQVSEIRIDERCYRILKGEMFEYEKAKLTENDQAYLSKYERQKTKEMIQNMIAYPLKPIRVAGIRMQTEGLIKALCPQMTDANELQALYQKNLENEIKNYIDNKPFEYIGQDSIDELIQTQISDPEIKDELTVKLHMSRVIAMHTLFNDNLDAKVLVDELRQFGMLKHYFMDGETNQFSRISSVAMKQIFGENHFTRVVRLFGSRIDTMRDDNLNNWEQIGFVAQFLDEASEEEMFLLIEDDALFKEQIKAFSASHQKFYRLFVASCAEYKDISPSDIKLKDLTAYRQQYWQSHYFQGKSEQYLSAHDIRFSTTEIQMFSEQCDRLNKEVIHKIVREKTIDFSKAVLSDMVIRQDTLKAMGQLELIIREYELNVNLKKYIQYRDITPDKLLEELEKTHFWIDCRLKGVMKDYSLSKAGLIQHLKGFIRNLYVRENLLEQLGRVLLTEFYQLAFNLLRNSYLLEEQNLADDFCKKVAKKKFKPGEIADLINESVKLSNYFNHEALKETEYSKTLFVIASSTKIYNEKHEHTKDLLNAHVRFFNRTLYNIKDRMNVEGLLNIDNFRKNTSYQTILAILEWVENNPQLPLYARAIVAQYIRWVQDLKHQSFINLQLDSLISVLSEIAKSEQKPEEKSAQLQEFLYLVFQQISNAIQMFSNTQGHTPDKLSNLNDQLAIERLRIFRYSDKAAYQRNYEVVAKHIQSFCKIFIDMQKNDTSSPDFCIFSENQHIIEKCSSLLNQLYMNKDLSYPSPITIDRSDFEYLQYILSYNDNYLEKTQQDIRNKIGKTEYIPGENAEKIMQYKQIQALLSKDVFTSLQIVTCYRDISDVAQLFVRDFDLTREDFIHLINCSISSPKTCKQALLSKLMTYNSVNQLLTAVKVFNCCDVPKFYKDQLMNQIDDIFEEATRKGFHFYYPIYQFLSEQIRKGQVVIEDQLLEAIRQYLLKRYEYQAEHNLRGDNLIEAYHPILFNEYWYKKHIPLSSWEISDKDIYYRMDFIAGFSDDNIQFFKKMIILFLSTEHNFEANDFEGRMQFLDRITMYADNILKTGCYSFHLIVHKNKIFKEIAQSKADFETLPEGQKEMLLAPVHYKDLIILLKYLLLYDVNDQILMYINNMVQYEGAFTKSDCQPFKDLATIQTFYDSGLTSEISGLIAGQQGVDFTDAFDHLRKLGFNVHRCKEEIKKLLDAREEDDPRSKAFCDCMRDLIDNIETPSAKRHNNPKLLASRTTFFAQKHKVNQERDSRNELSFWGPNL